MEEQMPLKISELLAGSAMRPEALESVSLQTVPDDGSKPTERAQKTGTRSSERGDLLEYFYQTVMAQWDSKFKKPKIGYIAYRLTGIPTKDLYALKSKMEDSRRRGYNPAKTFFYEIKCTQTKKESQSSSK